jgi:hypothetical protein
MSVNLPIPAGNFSIKINNSNIPEVPVGTTTNVILSKDLPQDIVQAISGQNPVYATLGCRTNGVFEYVLIEKGSYVSQTRQITLVRGQSPFATGSGGNAIAHNSLQNGIELNFNVIYPEGYKELATTVQDFANGALDFITLNIPKANTLQVGGVKTSYNNPAKTPTDAYQVITNDNPLIKRVFSALLSLPEDSFTLNFTGDIDGNTLFRLGQIDTLMRTLFTNQTKFNAFINWINNSL